MNLSRKTKAFMILGIVVLVSFIFLKFILWGKVAFAPIIGV